MGNMPIFFCENCGAVVQDSDARCPDCGKGFAGVKCPRCKHRGTTLDFTNGCPKCHYRVDNKEAIKESKIVSSANRASIITFPVTALIFTLAIVFMVILYSYAT